MCIRHLERLNDTRGEDGKTSIFYQKVDFDRVGTAGHSQGGVGVINAITSTEYRDLSRACALAGTQKPGLHLNGRPGF